jgi:hypothetical protein
MRFAEMLFSDSYRRLSRKCNIYTLYFQDFVSIVEKFGGQNILYMICLCYITFNHNKIFNYQCLCLYMYTHMITHGCLIKVECIVI